MGLNAFSGEWEVKLIGNGIAQLPPWDATAWSVNMVTGARSWTYVINTSASSAHQ